MLKFLYNRWPVLMPFSDGSVCTPRACEPGNVFDESIKSCANHDECSSGENTCDPSAICTDKVPSAGQNQTDHFYTCECPISTIDTNPEMPGRSCEAKCQSGFGYNVTGISTVSSRCKMVLNNKIHSNCI